VGNISTNGYFRLYIYVQIKHEYIIPYLYSTTEEKNSSHKKM